MATDEQIVNCLNPDCGITGGRLGPGLDAIRQSVELCMTLRRFAGEGDCPMRAAYLPGSDEPARAGSPGRPPGPHRL